MYKPEIGISVSSFTVLKKIIFYYEPEPPYVLWDGQYERPYWGIIPHLKDDLKKIKELGINTVELCACGAWLKETITDNFGEALQMVKDAGLKVNSVHFPFAKEYCDIDAKDKDVRLTAVDYFKKIMKIAEPYNPKAFVAHPGYGEVEQEESEIFNNFCDSAERLIASTNSKFCVENMVRSKFYSKAEQMLKYLDRVKNSYVCVDTNHFLSDKAEDVIDKFGDRLGAIHVSDYDYVDELHMLPGEGKINWQAVIKSLEKANFNGAFVYELSMGKYGYTYEQVYNNYVKLFDEYNK